jgi:auxin efflux carrier family protein
MVCSLKQLWVLPAWAFVTITVAFCIGAAFRWIFHLPGWTVSATAINNANAMPLLLLQSVSHVE